MSHKEILKKLGYGVDDSHIEKVQVWRDIFERNTPESFDLQVRYNKNTGKAVQENYNTTKRVRKREYNPHIQACREWGSLFFNEHTKLVVDSDDADNTTKGTNELKYLNNHYNRTGLWANIEGQFPEVFGIGTVAIVTEYSSLYGVQHKYFPAEAILPIETRQGNICSVVFVSTFKKDDKEYILYNIHKENTGTAKESQGEKGVVTYPTGQAESYTISNKVFLKSKGNDGTTQGALSAAQFGLEEEYTSKVRLFSIFRPFNRRITGFNSAFGVPVYNDCIDQIFEINSLYNVKIEDTETSRRTIFIDSGILRFDTSGNASIPQHLYGVVVATDAMKTGKLGGEEQSFITEFAPNPHIDKYSTEIQAALNRFSKAVGLGNDAFRYDDTGIATATQIVSDNQEKYSNLKKHYSMMANEFVVLNRAILALANMNEAKSFDLGLEIGYHVQDSVIVDDETLKKTALEEYNAGLMSAEYYLEKHRGMSGVELQIELERLKSAKESERALFDMDRWQGYQTQYGDNQPNDMADNQGQ